MKTCSNVSTCVNTQEPSACEVGSKEDLPTARQGMEYDLAWSCAKDFEGSVRKRCQQCNRQDLEMLKPPSWLVIACIGPLFSVSQFLQVKWVCLGCQDGDEGMMPDAIKSFPE